MSRITTLLRQSVSIHFGVKALRAVAQAVETILAWQQRANARQRLAEMDERQLKDMGLTRADVSREVEKPFWRV